MPLRNEQVDGSRRGGGVVTKKHMQKDDACSCHLHTARCAPHSLISCSPKTCQKILSDKIPLMKSLDHSKNKHKNPERRQYIFRNLLP